MYQIVHDLLAAIRRPGDGRSEPSVPTARPYAISPDLWRDGLPN